jgi:hypothetical protein
MYNRMLKREDESIEKLHQVIDFATGDDCMSSPPSPCLPWIEHPILGLAQSLATYFGDDDVVPGGLCGNCTFCKTGEPVTFGAKAVTSADPKQILAILNACPERDDPRLLARMAFGITSPRLTNGKWSTNHPLFGTMVNVDFNCLVAAFDKECEKAGYKRVDLDTNAPTAPKKRSSTNSSYQGSSSRGNRGSKRGRWGR